MNKLLAITFCLAFGIAGSTFGQGSMSISSGMNYSNTAFKNIEFLSSEPRIGYFFGFAPGYQINENLRLVVDFQYSIKGYKPGDNDELTASEYRFTYFDIMPELEYAVLNYLSLGIGMNYGLKLMEQHKIGDRWTDDIGLELVGPNDFGLTGKVQVNYNNLFGFVRYNMGLRNISELDYRDANGDIIDNAKQLNRNVQLGIGYTFKAKNN